MYVISLLLMYFSRCVYSAIRGCLILLFMMHKDLVNKPPRWCMFTVVIMNIIFMLFSIENPTNIRIYKSQYNLCIKDLIYYTCCGRLFFLALFLYIYMFECAGCGHKYILINLPPYTLNILRFLKYINMCD